MIYKPYYVYELVDPTNDEVFYVGKGIFNRKNEHEKEAEKIEDEENAAEKIKRIKSLSAQNKQPIKRVIGRYQDENAAFAVESTLIHWVYGFENLTNIQPGHGAEAIRPFGAGNVEKEGLDKYDEAKNRKQMLARAMEVYDTSTKLRTIKKAISQIVPASDISMDEENTQDPAVYVKLNDALAFQIILRPHASQSIVTNIQLLNKSKALKSKKSKVEQRESLRQLSTFISSDMKAINGDSYLKMSGWVKLSFFSEVKVEFKETLNRLKDALEKSKRASIQ
ncbi:GIY-YIG nuclease family protein [Alteromonas mediterranea]|uniref:GIY-YIG nuclease family protein n=1 Tax=Alteromonas mediterranea TaxID=314275 RepID=UPI001130DCE8|nr:GIY-YIG nuclease family protein [Alteromonas mediterranea]QDG39543.1 GIY-YIG nuclease family protein [Alteromonas mediterranea]